MSDNQQPPAIAKAIRLYRDGNLEASRSELRKFLLREPAHLDALLWLAKVTPDAGEAQAAAELGLKLDPSNEVAQRAVIAVNKQQARPVGEGTLTGSQLSAAIAVSTGMTLGQARAVRWRFQGIYLPIGEALDAGKIALRDLAWAVDKAWDGRIRDACRTILLNHLVGAPPQGRPLPLRVVPGSRYSERRERRAILFTGMILGMTVAAWLASVGVLLWIFAGQFGLVQPPPQWLGLAALPFLGLMWAILGWADRFSEKADQYRMGRWGEERAVDELRYCLDGRWTLFRNLEWPNRQWGDADIILVGPQGVAVLEVKSYSMEVRNIGDLWERKKGRGWRRLTAHPGKQARKNAVALRDYLKNHGIHVRWVSAAVLWSGEPQSLTVQDPAVPVLKVGALADGLEILWEGRQLNEDTAQQIVQLLEG
jgi:hypothetical protein